MFVIKGTLTCDTGCLSSAFVDANVQLNGIYSSIYILEKNLPERWTIQNGKYICDNCSEKLKKL